MNEEHLKLQAYFDGELGAAEQREIANLLARDPDAVAQLHSLKATRQALTDFEAGVKLPESRDFYWSKIRRDIERAEQPRTEAPAPSLFARLRRMLMPAAGLALLMTAGLLTIKSGWHGGSDLETALMDTKAFTYRDYSEGTTLVWLSYPAEEDRAAARSRE